MNKHAPFFSEIYQKTCAVCGNDFTTYNQEVFQCLPCVKAISKDRLVSERADKRIRDAAPDLLKLVRDMFEAIKAGGIQSNTLTDTDGREWPFHEEWANLASQILAKAEEA